MDKLTVVEICRIAQESFATAIQAADRSGDSAFSNQMRIHSQRLVDNCNMCQLHAECSQVAWCQDYLQRVLLPEPRC